MTHVMIKKLNKMTIAKNHGTLKLADSKYIKVTDEVNRKPHELGIKIYNVVLQGVESTYCPNDGGPFKKTQPTVIESIIFYSLVARGQMSIKNGSDEGELTFSAELKDVVADVKFNFYKNDPQVHVTGWRVLDYFIHDLSPIEPERDTANAMLNGYLSQEVPAALEQYLRDMLFDILKDEIESTTQDPCKVKLHEEEFSVDIDVSLPEQDDTGGSEGPDPGSAEYDAGSPKGVDYDAAGGPDPGSAEYEHSQGNDGEGSMDVPDGGSEGPDPGSAEYDHAGPPAYVNYDAAGGPDPGSAEYDHSQEYALSKGSDPGSRESQHAGNPDEVHATSANIPDPVSREDQHSQYAKVIDMLGASGSEGPDPGSRESQHAGNPDEVHGTSDNGTDPGSREDQHSRGHAKLGYTGAGGYDGPDPGSRESQHAVNPKVIHSTSANGPDPGSREDQHSRGYAKLGYTGAGGYDGPDPGSRESQHAVNPVVIHSTSANGPDPGSREDKHSKGYVKLFEIGAGGSHGPDPGSREYQHAGNPQVVHGTSANGPDPGSREDQHSRGNRLLAFKVNGNKENAASLRLGGKNVNSSQSLRRYHVNLSRDKAIRKKTNNAPSKSKLREKKLSNTNILTNRKLGRYKVSRSKFGPSLKKEKKIRENKSITGKENKKHINNFYVPRF